MNSLVLIVFLFISFDLRAEVTALTSESDFSCAAIKNSAGEKVQCWGYNRYGQARTIPGLHEIRQLSSRRMRIIPARSMTRG